MLSSLEPVDKQRNKNIYLFKLKKHSKKNLCLQCCSCFGLVPTCTKSQKKFNKLLEKGEERLNNYVNAHYIWAVILEHHNILKELNNTNKPLRDKVYDYVINLSSEED